MALKIIGLKHTAFTRERTFEGIKLFVTTTASAKYISFDEITIVSNSGVTVDWGDGAHGTQLYHYYATAGNFVITFTGEIKKVRSYAGYSFMNGALIKKAVINSPVDMTVDGQIASGTCTGLKEVVFGNHVKKVGTSGCIFGNMGTEYGFAVERVVFNTDSCEISEGAFYSGQNYSYAHSFLKNVNIPNGCKAIPENCFMGCTSLTGIVIPEGVESIGQNAFRYSNIGLVDLPSTLRTLGDRAFYSCEQAGSILVRSGITHIGNYAFFGTNITSITLPETVSTLGSGAFANCKNLVTADFSATKISVFGAYLFDNDTALRIVKFPSTTTSLNNIVTTNGLEISELWCYATNPPRLIINVSCLRNSKIYVPQGCAESYKSLASDWKNYGLSDNIREMP